jgi:hypothetical protein
VFSFINKGALSFAFEKSVHHSLRLIRAIGFGERLDATLDGLVEWKSLPLAKQRLLQTNGLGSRFKDRFDPAVGGLVELSSGTTFSRSPQRSASRADIVSPV